MAYLSLPTKKDDLAVVLKRMIAAGESARNIRKVGWLVTHWYLQGARSFSALNYARGTVRYRYASSKGSIDYRYEDVLRKLQTEQGRLLRIDTNPHVKREGNFSLDGLRNASMAQAVLNTLYREARVEAVKPHFLHTLLKFGTAGLACWGQESVRLGRYQPLVEVIPPWELLPIPAEPATASQVQGLIRVRYLPLDWLDDQLGKKLDRQGMDTIEVPYGSNPEKIEGGSTGDGSGTQGESGWDKKRTDESAGGAAKGTTPTTRTFAKTGEVFIPEPDGTLARFIVWVGGKVEVDETYQGKGAEKQKEGEKKEPPMMPIGVARYIDAGGFYGRSFVEPLLPTNMEVEFLLKRLFENAQDADTFGFVMVPLDQGVDFNQFKSTERPRIIGYQPDLTTPEHKPYGIRPYNTGDFPGKVAVLGREILREEAGHSEMMAGGAPGRVDSAMALGFLQETSSIPLAPVAVSIAETYETVNRAMLGVARERWPSETLASLTMLDDSLVGVVLDPESGRIKLDKNSIPYPTDVDVTIKAAVPQSVQQMKGELTDMHDRQIVTDRDFRRISRVKGLGFPVGNRAEYENFRKATLNNIIMFGNGKEPGTIIVSHAADNPEIHLEVLNDFMARPEFTLASPAVREAFEARQRIYQDALGMQMPQGMGNIEDEAAGMDMAGGPIGNVLARAASKPPPGPQAPRKTGGGAKTPSRATPERAMLGGPGGS